MAKKKIDSPIIEQLKSNLTASNVPIVIPQKDDPNEVLGQISNSIEKNLVPTLKASLVRKKDRIGLNYTTEISANCVDIGEDMKLAISNFVSSQITEKLGGGNSVEIKLVSVSAVKTGQDTESSPYLGSFTVDKFIVSLVLNVSVVKLED